MAAARSVFVSALSALWLALSGCATPPAPAPIPAVDLPKIIGIEFQQAIAAWNAGNLDLFVAIYAETATFAMPDGMLLGRAAIREYYAPLFAPGAERDELGLDRFDVEVLSPDAVLVRGVYRNSHQGRVVRRGPTTLIFRRGWEGWKIVHDHSS